MKEYDLFIPLLPQKKRQLKVLKSRLTKVFGGLTYFPHENEGFWKLGGVTFRDEIVILRVVSSETTLAEAYLKKLKREIKRDWNQKEVLIIARTVRLL